MKSFLKFLVSVSLLLSLGVAQADVTPDALVKQTADDVLTTLKISV